MKHQTGKIPGQSGRAKHLHASAVWKQLAVAGRFRLKMCKGTEALSAVSSVAFTRGIADQLAHQRVLANVCSGVLLRFGARSELLRR